MSLLFTAFTFSVEAQNDSELVSVSGTVTDEEGLPLPGVNVAIKGMQSGAVTDMDGQYNIEVASEGALIFSFLGFATKEISVDGRETIDVVMEEDFSGLDEVVIVGASLKSGDLTGAVSSVDEETLKERPVTTINDALQGRASGVNIQTDPSPSGNSSIRIRGYNSLQYGGNPIYVVDGIIMDNDFNLINVNDVESINVLKDASATALYGSRGANGVVVVTTKKGKKGEGQIGYDTWVGVQNFTNSDLTLGAQEMYDLRIDALANSNVAEDYYVSNPNATREDFIQNELLDSDSNWFADYEHETYESGESYNWLDQVTRPALKQNHSLNFSGGSEKNSYFLSLGYIDSEGVMKNSSNTRYTARLNAEQEIKPWLKVGTNTSFTRSENEEVDGAVFGVARNANPLLPISRAEDSLFLAWGNNWDINAENPLKTLQMDKDRTRDKLASSNYVEITPIDNLVVRSTFAVDITSQEYFEYIPSDIQQAERDSHLGRAIHNYDKTNYFQWDNSISYDRTFNKHRVNAVVSTSMSKEKFQYTNVLARDFPIDDFSYKELGGAFDRENFQLDSDFSAFSLMSYLARANYDYDKRYFATITARYDGSSRFAEGYKWGVFPSMALSWNITNEAFMADQNIFDLAKFRVGYGSVGNQSIPNYAFYSLYNPNYANESVSFNSTGLRGTHALTWEKQDQFNVGLDLALFNNRLELSAEYFNIVNSNLLMQRTLSTITGYNSAIENIGELTNRGVELSLNGLLVDTEDWTWDMAVNFSTDQNEITQLYGDVDAIYNFGGFTGTDIQRTGNFFLGESLNTIYTWEFDRIIQEEDMDYVNSLELPGKTLQPGDILPKDQQEEGEPGHGIINEEDRIIVGKQDPKFYGGFSSQASYKNLSLNAVFTYSYGGKTVSGFYEGLMNGTGFSPAHKDMLDRWTPENTDTNIPRATYDNPERFGAGETSWGLQDTSFLRLATLTLSYDFPNSVNQLLNLNRLRIYGTANNLATWTDYKGYDPENGDWYPTARMFVVGLNVSL